MRSFLIAAAGLALSAFATPLTARAEECEDKPCLTQAQADKVANNFKTLIADYSNATATAVLTTNFTDYSDSVTELINSGCKGPQPLGQPTFNGRAAFEAGQGSQPPIPFQILKTWHNCDTVAMRWRTTVDKNATQFVTGIIILETTYQDSDSEPFLINTAFSEFNSGAWLVDLGVFNPSNCSAPTKRDAIASPPFRIL